MRFYERDKDLSIDKINNYNSELYKILGSYKDKQYRIKLIVECPVCKQDPELFLDGLFDIGAKELSNGVTCCGCSSSPQWEEWQYKILLQRRASQFNCEFLGWSSEYIGSQTRTKMHCKTHDIVWNGNCINDCRRYPILCADCHSDKMSELIRKPDEEMIKNFIGFPEGTEFKRSDKKSKLGFKEYWDVWCPACKVSYNSNYKSLSQGCRGCHCSNSRQKQLYLNIVYSNTTPVALKFGVANDSDIRLKVLNQKSNLRLENYAVWNFEYVADCLKAETEFKQTLETGVISREEMWHGWTETTYLSNIDYIISKLDRIAERRIVE